jgi:hypothetical protein
MEERRWNTARIVRKYKKSEKTPVSAMKWRQNIPPKLGIQQ